LFNLFHIKQDTVVLTFICSSTIEKAKNVVIDFNVYSLIIDQHFGNFCIYSV